MRVCRSVSLTWLVVLALQFSCSDSGDGGGGGVSTGLPATQKLSSLDDAGAKQICTSIARGFNTFLTSSEKRNIECASLAIPLSIDEETETGDVDTCKQLVDRCLKGEKISQQKGVELDNLVDETECDDTEANAGIKECDATVADFESCGNAVLDEFSSLMRLIDCDNLKDLKNVQAKVEAGLDSEKLPECKTLTMTCPEVELGD